jgi:hypothetical protein
MRWSSISVNGQQGVRRSNIDRKVFLGKINKPFAGDTIGEVVPVKEL